MRTLLFILALTLGLLTNPAKADVSSLGHEVPFPLSAQIPFTWNTIDGTWVGEDKDVVMYYSFQVLSDCAGSKFLKVYHIEPEYSVVVSEGRGYAYRDGKTVRAIMRGDSQYMLIVRSFRDERSAGNPKVATVLTLRQLSTPNVDERHLILKKLSGNPFEFISGGTSYLDTKSDSKVSQGSTSCGKHAK